MGGGPCCEGWMGPEDGLGLSHGKEAAGCCGPGAATSDQGTRAPA